MVIYKKLENADIQLIDGDRGVHYPNKSDFSKSGYCVFLNTGNVTVNGFDFSNIDYISKERDGLLRKGKVDIFDIVLTTRGTVGNVAYISENIPYKNIRINSGMVIIRVNKNEIFPYFLYSFFRSFLFKKQCSSNGSGSAQPQLPISALKNIAFPDFDLKKQQKIANILSTLDRKIALNQQINQKLEAMAKQLYDYWFVQFDFPDENGKPYKSSGGEMVWCEALKREVPKGWEVGSLENIGEIVGGSTPSTSNPENFSSHGIAWITPNDLSNNQNNKFISHGYIDISEIGMKSASLKLYPKGTVLLSSRAPIGYMAIARNDLTTNQGFKSFVPNKGYSEIFIYYTVKNLIPIIEKYSSGSTFKEVSATTLKSIKCILGNKKIIQSFVKRLENIFRKQNILEIETQKLTQLRDFLLPMLMNGQVSVK